MTTAPLLAAIDDTIEIVAARFDHVLELLVAEHRRLEQLAGMRELAEQLDPSSPPDAAAEPADTHGQDTHAAAAPAPPAAALPTDERTQAPEHTPPPAARSVGHVPEPPARRADRAGGTGSVGRDGLTEKQSALVTAVNSLGECTLSQICEHVGRVGEEVAVRSALLTLRDRGLIQHNGKNSRAGR